jgi:hypothetical protein
MNTNSAAIVDTTSLVQAADDFSPITAVVQKANSIHTSQAALHPVLYPALPWYPFPIAY